MKVKYNFHSPRCFTDFNFTKDLTAMYLKTLALQTLAKMVELVGLLFMAHIDVFVLAVLLERIVKKSDNVIKVFSLK